MPPPATRYATTTPINPTATVAGVRYRLELTDIPALAGFWADAEDTNKSCGRSYDDATGAEYATHWKSYDHASKTAVVIVYVPSVLASGAPKLRVYPPVAANTAYLTSDTYGRDACYPGVIAAPLDGLADVSGNGRDFVAESGAGITTAAGKVGTAVKFPSVGGYAAYDAGAGGISGFPLTVMCWLKADDWSQRNHQSVIGITSELNPELNPDFRITARSTTAMWPEYFDGVSFIKNQPSDPLVSNVWSHYATVLTASSMTTYRNGVLVDTDAHSLSAPSLRYLLLAGDSVGMAGLIDEAHFIAADPTPAWFAYYYAMTDDPASFFSAWATEGGVVTAPSLSAEYGGSPVADGATVSLGNIVRTDTPPTVTITITNDGDADATSIVVTAGAGFTDTGTGTLGATLAPSASGTVILALDASAAGATSGTVSVASNDAASPLDATFTATIIAPVLTVTHGGSPLSDGDSIALGISEINEGDPITLILGNSGDSDLHISAASVTGDGTLTTDPTGLTIAPSSTAEMVVTPDYTATGAISGAISVTSDDTSSPFDLTFGGTVVSTPTFVSSSPANGAYSVSTTLASLLLVFSVPVKVGTTQTLRLYNKADDIEIESVAASSGTVNITDKTKLTLPLTQTLPSNVYVLWDAGLVLSLDSSTPNAANTDKTALAFSTESAPGSSKTRSRDRSRARGR